MTTVVQLRTSKAEKPTVNTGRGKNTDYRQREYLSEKEIDKLLAAAGEVLDPDSLEGVRRCLPLCLFVFAPGCHRIPTPADMQHGVGGQLAC